MTDFPAAHSMDTTWFAIDADGCVGIFSSSEGGAVPEILTKVSNNEIEFEGDLLELLAKDNGRLIDRDSIDLEFILQSMSMEDLLTEISENEELLQEYCDEQFPDTYDLERLPKKPVYFKDLPPEISQHIKLTKFPNLRFAQTKAIQPIEHMPCYTWGSENWQGTDGEWHEGFPEYPDRPSTDLI